MKTITLSDVDVQTIVDALRIKHALLVNELMYVQSEPTVVTSVEPKAEPKAEPVAKYGYRKDGTPRNPPGRPRKKKK